MPRVSYNSLIADVREEDFKAGMRFRKSENPAPRGGAGFCSGIALNSAYAAIARRGRRRNEPERPLRGDAPGRPDDGLS